MSHNHAFTAIYDCVIADCSPYEFSGPWSRLRADAAAHRGPTDSAALLERLQRAFPLDTLQRSGVVRLGPSGAPELDPELHGPDSALLAVRAAGSNAVLDLMTSRGCIARRSLPAIAILRDARTAQLLQNRSRPLCVSFSLPDVVLLRSLGVPATLGTGLERLGRAGLKAFCRIFHLGRGPRALLTSRGNRPDLLIAGWSPCRLVNDPPEPFVAVTDHFQGLHRHFDIEMRSVRVWRPSTADLESVRFALEHGDRRDVRNAFLRSMENSSQPLVPPVSRSPGNVAQAQLQLHELQRGNRSVDDKQALTDFEDLFETDVVAPQLQDAMAESAPQQRFVKMWSAEMSRFLGAQLGLFSRRLSQLTRAARRHGRDLVMEPELDALLKQADHIMRMMARMNKST